MSGPGLLNIVDLHEMQRLAMERNEQLPVAAQIAAAVDEGRLENPDDGPFALVMAAHLTELGSDVGQSLPLLVRATQAAGPGSPHHTYARAAYGRALLMVGRDVEGMAELTALRPLLVTEPKSVEDVTFALLSAERDEVAHEWLTEATVTARKAFAAATFEDKVERLALLHQLTRNRRDVRRALDLPDDEDDEFADELDGLFEEPEMDTVLYWPRDDFNRLVGRWPSLTEYAGADWDHHRALVETAASESAEDSASAPVILPASMDDLLRFLSETDLDPLDPDTMDRYVDTIQEDLGFDWPPQRNEACWCGSGVKYKKCCLPRSRQT